MTFKDEDVVGEVNRIGQCFIEARDKALKEADGYYPRLDREVSFSGYLYEELAKTYEDNLDFNLFIKALTILLPSLFDEEVIHGDFYKENKNE